MEFLSVKEISKIWGVSERTVRNYCAQGKIKGAVLVGKTWNVPKVAQRPTRENKIKLTNNNLLNILKEEKDMFLKGGIYHKTQIALTYNSNHIEGSTLTEEQTKMIFETKTIGVEKSSIKIDDIVETNNHFKCFNMVIDNAKSVLTEKFIKNLHFTLKIGTQDSLKPWFNVGEYKLRPNEIGGKPTCAPKQVANKMKELLAKYNSKKEKTIEDIIQFHKEFESIHPFQDGNGRVGRLIMFKECLNNNIVPFIIEEEFKFYYYRGLREWNSEKGFLIETCLACQDKYKKWLEYFEIEY